ncbi:hypothetical protein TSAR_012025 [Trichomalopsis sarcophagae]|uniref:Uncharacterized protein n=1 Tax=Trichomalopsis sarcophagae TaxID=543379 RepID=A0A232F8F1_9HYME|nr:hypothetical protein TSAR_012025 [Trichomalopsis sarcophagae]
MTSLPKVFVFTIACLVLGAAKAEVKTALEKHLDHPDQQLFFSAENLNVNNHRLEGLPYALCKTVKEATSSRLTEMRCKIVVHSQTPPEKSCNISLIAAPSTATTHSRIGNLIKLIKFGSQKAVLLWFEESIVPSVGVFKGKIRSSIVDLTTCQSKEVVLLEEMINSSNIVAYANVIPYEDSFDVIIGFPTAEWYKFSVDSKGRVTENKPGWVKSGHWISQFTSVASGSRSKGYLRFNEEFNFSGRRNLKSEIILIKPDGSQKQLMDQTVTGKKSVSTVHQAISIAFAVNDKTVKIQKFDQEGNSKLHFSVDFDYTIANLLIRNLADGGFLLLTTSKDKPYHVTKLDSSGQRIGHLELGAGFKKNHGVTSYLYSETVALEDDPSGGYCLSSVYSPTIKGQLREESDLDLLVKCFSDSDFFSA